MALLTAEKHTKTNHMPSREIIITKRVQKMTDLLGHSNIFATLSSQVLTANYTILNFAGVRA